MLPRNINIGPLTLHFYGVIIAGAILICWRLAKHRAPIYKIPRSFFDDPILAIPLILGIFGARLYHVIDYWDYYQASPGQIIQISSGGLGIWGALAGIFAGFWLVAKIKKINLLAILDLISPSILLGQAIGRIGNYINQEGFGPPTNLPWGVFISPENRPMQFMNSTHFHPTFFYEAVLNLVAFLILIFLSNLSSSPLNSHSHESGNQLRGKQRGSRFSIWSLTLSVAEGSGKAFAKPGQTFALYLILYSIIRFIVEFWRIDTWIVSSIKIAHLLSLAIFLLGIFLLVILRKKEKAL